MFKNLSKLLFLSIIFFGSIISISSNSWMGLWMGFEINLLSFIPLISNSNNLNQSEASLNYFMVQSLSSAMILFSMMMFMLSTNLNFLLNYSLKSPMMLMIIITLMLKMGASPFHFWFPNVMENLSWTSNMILMTWQKLAPMMILSYLVSNNINKNMLLIFIFLSVLTGAIGGLNQLSIRKMLAFSSINHMGWMIATLMFNENFWFMYFIIYSFLNFSIIFVFKIFQIYYLSQLYSMFLSSYFMKFYLFNMMMSLGGLPPFLGFMPKWLVIQSMMLLKLNFMNLILIMMSLITLFYYLKICFASTLMNYSQLNWMYKSNFNLKTKIIMTNMNFISLLGIALLMNLMEFLN